MGHFDPFTRFIETNTDCTKYWPLWYQRYIIIFACLGDIYRESICIWVTLVSPIVCIQESYRDSEEPISHSSRNQSKLMHFAYDSHLFQKKPSNKQIAHTSFVNHNKMKRVLGEDFPYIAHSV